MAIQSLNLIKIAIAKCVDWTTQLLHATGGAGVVLAAFLIVLVIGLLFIPMRGGNIVPSVSDMMKEYTFSGAIHKKERGLTISRSRSYSQRGQKKLPPGST